MTELIITPNYDKKTARFKGTIAGGERVKVTIVGAAKWLSSGLRLRVVCGCSLTVAMFPLKSEDGTVSSFEVVGDDLIAAPLELNTIQARLYTQGFATTAATFIVEDLEKNILYFQDSYELHGWVKRDGDEEPYDLTKFPELIEDWRKQIEGLNVDAKEVDGGIEVTICNGISPAKTFIIRNGRDGQPGETGRKGEDGKSLKFSDLTDAQKAELKGPKGDTGEGVTDELKALPDKVTQNAQAIEVNRVAINTEENRAKGAEKELLTRIEESKANAAAAMTAASKAQDTADKTVTEIATLVGDDAGDKRKSARQIAAEEVAKVIAGADTNYDTLKEIADYIKSDATDAAQLKNKVTNLEANKADKLDVVALDERVTELEENGGGSSVEVVAPSPDGEGKAADAKAVYEALEEKQNKLKQGDNITISDDGTISASGGDVDVVAAIEGKEIKPSSVVVRDKNSTIKMNDVYPFNFERTSGVVVKQVNIEVALSSLGINLRSLEHGCHSGDARYGCEGFGVVRSNNDGSVHDFGLSVKSGKVTYIGSDNPEGIIENTIANMVNAMPRYRFVDAAIVDGVVMIAPYTNAKIASDGTAFTVAVGEVSGYARDCVLVVDCEATPPSVIFDATVFFPRGGDASNLVVVAGKRNVFFITEVQQNVFMVARDELELPEEGGGE